MLVLLCLLRLLLSLLLIRVEEAGGGFFIRCKADDHQRGGAGDGAGDGRTEAEGRTRQLPADADREAEVLALDPLPELEEATYMSTLLPTVTLVPDEGVVRSTVPGAAVSEFS